MGFRNNLASGVSDVKNSVLVLWSLDNSALYSIYKFCTSYHSTKWWFPTPDWPLKVQSGLIG